MSDDGKYVVDKRAPRVDWERLKEGPSEADLAELPATTEADWQDAELLIPIDPETYREFREFLNKRRRQVGRPRG